MFSASGRSWTVRLGQRGTIAQVRRAIGDGDGVSRPKRAGLPRVNLEGVSGEPRRFGVRHAALQFRKAMVRFGDNGPAVIHVIPPPLGPQALIKAPRTH